MVPDRSDVLYGRLGLMVLNRLFKISEDAP
jgi:hypothetical protein